jgi:hypothetical protein
MADMPAGDANLVAAWAGFLAGALSGLVAGACFHRADWLGGYAAWPRRLVRLAHISSFGLGLLNLAFALTAARIPEPVATVAGSLLVAGLAAMAPCCWLAAWAPRARLLFAAPVACVAGGATLTLVGLLA